MKTEAGVYNREAKGCNQDRGFFHSESEYTILGICDGHGTLGHIVAEFLAHHFLRYACEVTPTVLNWTKDASLMVLMSHMKKS